MELHTAHRMMRGTAEACRRYLERVPFTNPRQHTGAGPQEALDFATDPAEASFEHRLESAVGTEHAPRVLARDRQGRLRLNTSPPLNRSSMIPRRWPPKFWQVKSWWRCPRLDRRGASPPPRGRWHRSASIRRSVLGVLMLAQTIVATDFMAAVLPYHGTQPLEIALLVLFAILFAWVSSGFWTALMGFVVQLFGGDRYMISRTAAPRAPIATEARTAIVMPIRNEDVARVFAGLRATYESLEKTGEIAHFDFFVLSDSSDADARVAEVAAWDALCREVDGFARIYYRWRTHRIKRKSGNIADFCRRWGT